MRNRDPEAPSGGPMPAWASCRRRPLQLARRLRPRTLLLIGIGLAAMIVYAASPEPPSGLSGGAPITGRVGHVVDGDTLDLQGRRIRLTGLDAPELDQSCTDAEGRGWTCGEVARTALRKLASGSELDCAPSGTDRYGRTLARCRSGQGDLGETMVRQGLALASGGYAEAEAEARAARRGLWAGRFAAPADWRREHGREAADAAETPSRFERFVRWLLGAING